jgi:hypothetical protein
MSSEKRVEPKKKQNVKAVLAFVSVGWVFFGVAFGLLQDKILGFVLSLVMAAWTGGLALYLWRRDARGTVKPRPGQ